MKRALVSWGLVLLAGPLLAARGTRNTEVIVVGDVSPAGSEIAPPTREAPVYYLALAGGFQERGAIVAREKSPPAEEVGRVLHRALASQHYLPATSTSPSPSLMLVYLWGYMNPDIMEDMPDEDPEAPPNPTLLLNRREMLALVGGYKVKDFDFPSFDRERILTAAHEDRYFIVVTAYDFKALERKEKIVLWRARMSLPSTGTNLTQAVPTLVANGAPFFGRQTSGPEWIQVTRHSKAEVDVGTPVVVPDNPAPPSERR